MWDGPESPIPCLDVRFEQMLALRDRELFRRLEETMGRMTTKVRKRGKGMGRW
jgi:hypothetical protein